MTRLHRICKAFRAGNQWLCRNCNPAGVDEVDIIAGEPGTLSYEKIPRRKSMKKCILILAVSIFFLLSGIWKGYQILHTRNNQEKQITKVVDQQDVPRVTLTIVEEQSISTYSGILALTAFEALQSVAADKHILLKTKTYDFGIFVEEIGGKPNLKDHAWLYFVNGVSGDAAADKKILKTGDLVEWRYMEPTY